MDQAQPGGPVLAEGSALIAGRMRSFLAAGGRALVLVGAPAAGRSAVLETVLADLSGRQVRVGNAGAGPLTMKRLLREMGLPRAEWSSGLFFRALAERAYDDVSAVIVVEDAQSLSPYALRALARVPGLGGPELPGMILVLAGDASLLGRLSAPGLEVLRNSRRALVLSLPDAGRSRPVVPGGPARLVWSALPAVVPAGGRAPLRVEAAPRLPARSWPFAWPAVAGGLAVAATMGLWSTQALPPAPLPGLATQPVVAVPVEVVPVEVVPVEVGPAVSPPLQPAEAAAKRSADAAMMTVRREFDAFLDRAGRDTAKLAPAARETLFREYLLWRVRAPGSP